MIREALMKEIEHEGSQTERVLARIPFENLGWKPHEKSKAIGELAIHVAQIPQWTSRILTTSEVDILTLKRHIPEITNNEGLVNFSEENIQKAVEDLQKASDEDLMAMWTLKRGGDTFFTLPRVVVIRNMAMNHLVHHRGQLTVYLRLLNIPVPGIYGPSADEMI